MAFCHPAELQVRFSRDDVYEARQKSGLPCEGVPMRPIRVYFDDTGAVLTWDPPAAPEKPVADELLRRARGMLSSYRASKTASLKTLRYAVAQYGSSERPSDVFSVASALYWYCCDYHGGKSSVEYHTLCALGYKPGASERGVDPDDGLASRVHTLLMRRAMLPEYVAHWVAVEYRKLTDA